MLKKMYDLQKKKGKKGFSMIELIIVLAIMAILVALIGTQLIPYLEKSREKRDMTTLDTILTAVESTVAEHEGLTVNDGDKVSVIFATGSTELQDFEKYAGLAVGDSPFKSDAASGSVGDVTIQVDANDVITGATSGTLAITRD